MVSVEPGDALRSALSDASLDLSRPKSRLEEASHGCELDREAPEAVETAEQRRFFGHRHSGEARTRLHKGHRAAQAPSARGAAARARQNARGKQGLEGACPQ